MELSSLKGVGPARVQSLRAVGIVSLRDLLFFLPLRYEDHTTRFPCATRREGNILVRGTIATPPTFQAFHGKTLLTISLRDDSGSLKAQWFNAPWMRQHLQAGKELTLYGRMSVKKGRAVLNNPRIVSSPGWLPVYRAIPGIPQKSLRALIEQAFLFIQDVCPETLPERFRQEHQLIPLEDALLQVHHPESLEMLSAAHRRLYFERMLLYLVYASMAGSKRAPAHAFHGCSGLLDEYWRSLPFPPTNAQQRVLAEIAGDLEKEQVMARLVQGDVGCGKTAIAFGALTMAARSGYQAALMAPTEILAEQHYRSAMELLFPRGIRCALLTGATKVRERKAILQALAEGAIDVLIGTHALFSTDVQYAHLGLVITDEQHRFGVTQRASLREKGHDVSADVQPHVLVMSATPIPRSLALILYGDLDLSLVNELPAGRKPVRTRIVPEGKRADMYDYVHQEIRKGAQVYIVCPLVEDDEDSEESDGNVRSAAAVHQQLQEGILADYRVGLTWGAQKSEEKNQTLEAFLRGELDVLVATTVIEVGVNNPRATIMIIENAERFGLSQLHQLRGRVGRGDAESWCFLVSDQRGKLQILAETNDGFQISQKDLEMRGPGDLLGIRQSGGMLDDLLPGGDLRLLDEAAASVRALHRDPTQKETLAALEAQASALFQGREMDVS